MVGVMPTPAAPSPPAGAVRVEAHDEWRVSDRRYLSEGLHVLLKLIPTSEEVAQARPDCVRLLEAGSRLPVGRRGASSGGS